MKKAEISDLDSIYFSQCLLLRSFADHTMVAGLMTGPVFCEQEVTRQHLLQLEYTTNLTQSVTWLVTFFVDGLDFFFFLRKTTVHRPQDNINKAGLFIYLFIDTSNNPIGGTCIAFCDVKKCYF